MAFHSPSPPANEILAACSSPSFVFLCLQIPNLRSTTMAPRKLMLAKRQCSSSTSQAAPPPLEDPHRFISQEAERIYHESLFNRSFIPERGFPTSNVFFNFTIQNRGWQALCAPPVPRVASVVREFHSNLPFKVDTTVFCLRQVGRVWCPGHQLDLPLAG